MADKEEKDGLVHIQVGPGSQFAPCGARVSSIAMEFDGKTFIRHPKPPEPLQQSCGDDLERATCPSCKAAVARLVRAYRKATRGKVKWSEDYRKNVVKNYSPERRQDEELGLINDKRR